MTEVWGLGVGRYRPRGCRQVVRGGKSFQSSGKIWMRWREYDVMDNRKMGPRTSSILGRTALCDTGRG